MIKPTYNRLGRINILILSFLIGYPIIISVWLYEKYTKTKFYKYFTEPIYELNEINKNNTFNIFNRIKK
jgi:hypothetical protein